MDLLVPYLRGGPISSLYYCSSMSYIHYFLSIIVSLCITYTISSLYYCFSMSYIHYFLSIYILVFQVLLTSYTIRVGGLKVEHISCNLQLFIGKIIVIIEIDKYPSPLIFVKIQRYFIQEIK